MSKFEGISSYLVNNPIKSAVMGMVVVSVPYKLGAAGKDAAAHQNSSQYSPT